MGELQTKRYFEMLSRIFDDAALLHEYAVSLEAKDNECEGECSSKCYAVIYSPDPYIVTNFFVCPFAAALFLLHKMIHKSVVSDEPNPQRKPPRY
jgi:hypothetical protein